MGSFRFLWLACLLLVAADLLAVRLYSNWAQRVLSGEPLQQVDAAAVLFHGFREFDGLSKESLRRVSYAHWLYRTGRTRQIVCVGGERLPPALSGAALMRDTLVALGVSADLVLTAPPSFDSTTNVEAIGTITKQEHWQSVLIVSSSLHLLRVRRAVDRLPGRLPATFGAYDVAAAQPDVGFAELWCQVHYEWGSWLLTVMLSREQLQALAKFIRF